MKISFAQIKKRLQDMAFQHGCELMACGVRGDDIEFHAPTSSTVRIFLKGELLFVVSANTDSIKEGMKAIRFTDETTVAVEPIKGFEQWFPPITSSAS
jgi:hypothetical protein